MKIILEKDISNYATPEEFSEMFDDDIIDLCMEDITYLIDNAEWKVIREEDENNKS